MNNKNTIDFKETEEFKEIFRNEIKKDVKEFNLSSFELVSFVYDNYLDDCELFYNHKESYKSRRFLEMLDRYNANEKSNVELINLLIDRSEFVSDKAIEKYNLIKK